MSDTAETANTEKRLFSLVILAGGKSLRFGEDKSLLLKLGDKPLIEVLLDRFGDLFAKTVIVSDRLGKFNLPGALETVDNYPMRGPLGGMQAGLEAVRTSWALVMACDMPGVERGAIERLIAAAAGTSAQAVVPKHECGFEPLCAMYRSDILGIVEDLLVQNKDRPGPLELLRRLDVQYLETENCFFNINTRQDAKCMQEETKNSDAQRKRRYRDFFGKP